MTSADPVGADGLLEDPVGAAVILAAVLAGVVLGAAAIGVGLAAALRGHAHR